MNGTDLDLWKSLQIFRNALYLWNCFGSLDLRNCFGFLEKLCFGFLELPWIFGNAFGSLELLGSLELPWIFGNAFGSLDHKSKFTGEVWSVMYTAILAAISDRS